MNETKQRIIYAISDLCSNFLYYDRKENEYLTSDHLEEAVDTKVITVDEMVEEFRKHIEDHFGS